jgi:hypothetical protein
MRRFLILACLLLTALAVYAYFPRSKQPPQLAEPVISSPQAVTEPIPPRRVVPQANPDASAADRSAVANEAALMRQIRENVKANPALAESLAREGRQRFPDSADSDERDALLVDALINQQRIGAARSETYYYLDHHSNGRYVEHLFVMTGVHPTPRSEPDRR